MQLSEDRPSLSRSAHLCYKENAPGNLAAPGAELTCSNRIMRDPILHRVACAATVYWEMDPAGPRVARLIVDCPLPVLEAPADELEADPAEAAQALTDWMQRHPIRPQEPIPPAPPAWEPSTSYCTWEAAA